MAAEMAAEETTVSKGQNTKVKLYVHLFDK